MAADQVFLLTNQASDLSQRLVRSYHWSRKAHLEPNRQLQVLFRWFAMEAVWMLNKDDDIVPRLLWALGFPNGPGAGLLSSGFVKALRDHPTIGAWKKQIEDRLLRMKSFRNDSVHGGFRRQDVAPETLRDFDEITTLACARVQACARAGVMAKLSSAAELFEYPEYFLTIDGTAKLLAAAAIGAPRFPVLREWAYAGLTFLTIGATWSHLANHQSPAAPVVVLLVAHASRWLWARTRADASGVRGSMEPAPPPLAER